MLQSMPMGQTCSMRVRSSGVTRGQLRRVGICQTYCAISTASVYMSTPCSRAGIAQDEATSELWG